jgi:transcriptional regulator with XRE-family HTH domain
MSHLNTVISELLHTSYYIESLAKKCGISRPLVSLVLLGKRRATTGTVAKLCAGGNEEMAARLVQAHLRDVEESIRTSYIPPAVDMESRWDGQKPLVCISISTERSEKAQQETAP